MTNRVVRSKFSATAADLHQLICLVGPLSGQYSERKEIPVFVSRWAKKAGLDLTPSQRAAICDGNAWATMVGFGDTYVSPCGILLKGSNFQLSLLASLPPFVGAIAQLFTLWVLQFVRSRRTLTAITVLTHAVIWLCLALLPLLVPAGQTAVWCLIILATLAQVSGNAGAPAWNSLMGDMVPAKIRGRYFGFRNFTMGVCTFVAITIAGQALDLTSHHDSTIYGFFAVFFGASIARFISGYWTLRYDDLPHETTHKKHYFSFWQFLLRLPRSNFTRFVFYTALVGGAVAFAGPFFTLYMLRDLGLTYTEFTIVTVTNTVVQFLVMQYWGKLSDAFGNKNILNLLGYGVSLAPVLWIFGSSIPYLIVIQAFNGFVWAGFNLAAANFLFDAVSPAKRARCTAYQAVVNGILVLIGAMSGGIVVDYLPHTVSVSGLSWSPSSPLMFMFALSGLVRIIAAVILLPMIRDAGDKKPIKHYELLFQIARIRPMSGVSFEVVSGGNSKTQH